MSYKDSDSVTVIILSEKRIFDKYAKKCEKVGLLKLRSRHGAATRLTSRRRASSRPGSRMGIGRREFGFRL